MPSTYTLNNGIEIIATGEQSGTWGDTTNTNLSLIDTALDGQVSITLGATGSSGSPNNLPVTDGTASNGRNRLIIFGDGGDLGGTAFVQLTPSDSEKIIYVRNNLSGSRSILLFQGTYNASNDYEVPAGKTAVVFFDGAGSGAVAANIFNNAHFDAINVVGNVVVGGTVAATGNITTSGTVEPAGDTAAGDNAAIGFTSAEGLILTGQGSTNDVTIKNDADADVLEIPTGTTNVTIAGNLGVGGTITGTGTSVFASLDISGDIDVDGTTNLDVVDIDGAVDMATTLTLAGNADFNGDLDVDGTTNLDVVDIDGAVDMATTLAVGTSVNIASSTTVNGVLDEDNMSSNSATKLATQQSIKAYVDSQITAEDLDFQGDSGTGSVDLDSQTLDISGTTNQIVTAASGQTLTVSLPSTVATTTADLTNIEVTNIKAKDGTAAGSIADSTGVVTLSSAVLTTADINGGTLDASVIGGSTAAAGTFTNITATGGSITGITDLALADGGTGASTASAARTNLDVDQAGTALALAIALG